METRGKDNKETSPFMNKNLHRRTSKNCNTTLPHPCTTPHHTTPHHTTQHHTNLTTPHHTTPHHTTPHHTTPHHTTPHHITPHHITQHHTNLTTLSLRSSVEEGLTKICSSRGRMFAVATTLACSGVCLPVVTWCGDVWYGDVVW